MTVRPLVVINVVGLTPALIGEHTPNLAALASDGFAGTLEDVFPAVTCTAQATMLTGTPPAQHGIVGNGWYLRDLAEVRFWRQSNALVRGEKVWETARAMVPGFRCAKLFWWYNMYASVDLSVTVRPIYPADGRKIPALYSSPASLQAELEDGLGAFPFFNFWGPTADRRSSDWIARCAAKVFREHRPALSLVYLPHLDYNFQRLGPDDPACAADVADIDAIVGRLVDEVRGGGADILVVSEYGIEPVDTQVHVNRLLRENGYLAVRDELGSEQLDPGASRAFAVADHQVAHVYVRDPADLSAVAELLRGHPAIDEVLDADAQHAVGVDHPRAGELIAVAAPGAWFTYYFWLDDARAPDFAPTVDIHRKPGYDPAELFVDPALRWPMLRVARRVLQKKLGLRMLMDVIPLDGGQVRGSHGRPAVEPDRGPIVIGSRRDLAVGRLPMTGVRDLILRHFATQPGVES